MLFLYFLGCFPQKITSQPDLKVPVSLAKRVELVEDIHGQAVSDPYRWMENKEDPELLSWVETRNQEFQSYSDSVSSREWLKSRFIDLWSYDDKTVPKPCLLDESRETFWSKTKKQDKWVLNLRTPEGDRILIDPNTWGKTETLAGFYPSPDCKMAAYGKANAGDENPVVTVFNIDTGEAYPDKLSGWKQGGVDWLHDNSGFYYSARPLAKDAPNGEKDYYHRVYFHEMGSESANDTIVLANNEVKEQFHGSGVSHDGRWLIHGRYSFDTAKLWLQDLKDPKAERIEMMPEMDAEYSIDIVDDKIFIKTDWNAPNYRIMHTTVDKPQREHWKELVPESKDNIRSMSLIGGHLYVNYYHKVSSLIKVFSVDGTHLKNVKLPSIGMAYVSGVWSRPRTILSFSTFTDPGADYSYDVEKNELSVLRKAPIDIDTSNIGIEQVFYPSKDGTQVSMFILRPKDKPVDEPIPFMLYGYGGFNISLKPSFNFTYAIWLQAGGGVAIPNLRGGGEYGQAWHRAGMRENKQNVFDDFIAAAEYLVDNKHTKSDRLAIKGGSNGGLLVSAVVNQRPELFRAVQCSVPLTDMIRFHKFGLANIWTEEYGSPDNPEHFKYLFKYSPYHNTKKGADYPAILVTGSLNDARTDPVHASKFSAAVRWADADHGTKQPIFLHLLSESGHHGGVGIETKADQRSRHMGFLMNEIGLKAP